MTNSLGKHDLFTHHDLLPFIYQNLSPKDLCAVSIVDKESSAAVNEIFKSVIDSCPLLTVIPMQPNAVQTMRYMDKILYIANEIIEDTELIEINDASVADEISNLIAQSLACPLNVLSIEFEGFIHALINELTPEAKLYTASAANEVLINIFQAKEKVELEALIQDVKGLKICELSVGVLTQHNYAEILSSNFDLAGSISRLHPELMQQLVQLWTERLSKARDARAIGYINYVMSRIGTQNEAYISFCETDEGLENINFEIIFEEFFLKISTMEIEQSSDGSISEGYSSDKSSE